MNRLLLIILDGWGIGPITKHNAVAQAKTPFIDKLWKEYPNSTLSASGSTVGLLPRQIGSSEVGHMHIGAGRVVEQELTRLHRALHDGSFYKNPVLREAFRRAEKKRKRVHLVGLVSNGGVHSHEKHLHALLKMASQMRCDNVVVHAITDGRDTPPRSSLLFLRRLEKLLKRYPVGRLADVCGRYYAMDRDKDWKKTKRAVELYAKGLGVSMPYQRAIQEQFDQDITDEFLPPIIVDSDSAIQDGDSVIFFNFRVDRMKQLVTALNQRVKNLHITTMVPYGLEAVHAQVAFDRIVSKNHFSEVLSKNKIRQLKIAETEKYAHVTYFFNGTQETAYPLEDRIIVPSKKVETFDFRPEMSTREITNIALKHLGDHQVITMNYCNADMVGHTGNLAATIRGCETIDHELARLVPKAQQSGYDIIITADHGNAEQMYDHRNDIHHTAHTTNRVPLIAVTNKPIELTPRGTLSQVAPLALELLGLKIPKEMGKSLRQ